MRFIRYARKDMSVLKWFYILQAHWEAPYGMGFLYAFAYIRACLTLRGIELIDMLDGNFNAKVIYKNF